MRSSDPLTTVMGVLALLAASTLDAQSLRGGGDLTVSDDYIWRGLTVGDRMSIQPAVWAAHQSGNHTLAGGVWTRLEPWESSGHPTSARNGSGALAEVDLWLQHTWGLFTAGLIHYVFVGDARTGAFAAEANSTELYLRLWPEAAWLPVEPRLVAYTNVADYQGGYLEFSLSESVPILPFWPGITPTGDVVFQATTGAFLDQDPGEEGMLPMPFQGRNGISHVDLAAIATLRVRDLVYGHVAAHHQWNVNEATRMAAPGVNRGTQWWFEGGVSLTLKEFRL